MTTRDAPWPEGTPCWVDLAVEDFTQGQKFYSELLGWEVPEGHPDFGGYSTCSKDGRNVAGLSPKMAPEQPSVWTTYLAVADLELTVAKVRKQGGAVVADPMTIADMGRMAVVADPAGAVVGLWEAGGHTGFQLTDEPGALTWCENLSRGWRQNKKFYAQIFGWSYDDMSDGGFKYATFKVGDQVAGGIGQMGDDWPSGIPSHWNIYFKVEDMAAATEHVKDLDGAVVRDPWETPFGTMAAVADNHGATFMLMADNDESGPGATGG
jgi:predicted enzyme related to lactoylglutathione lyase